MNEHAFTKKNNIVPMRHDAASRYRPVSQTEGAVRRSAGKKKNPFILRFFLVVLCGCVLYMGWIYFQLMGEVSQQKAELGALKQRVAESKQENENLQHQKQILNSDAFIEKIAREELGMIKDGEILMKVDQKNNGN